MRWVLMSISVFTLTHALTIPRGVLQIQDRSPQWRPVASECVCDWLSDATGLDCGDRSWICNTPQVYLSELVLSSLFWGVIGAEHLCGWMLIKYHRQTWPWPKEKNYKKYHMHHGYMQQRLRHCHYLTGRGLRPLKCGFGEEWNELAGRTREHVDVL